jgi:septum formation protein
MMGKKHPPLILASRSKARWHLLEAVGLDFTCVPAELDEAAITKALLSQRAKPERIARALAEGKALRVASHHPDALVIGSDQILVLDSVLIDKAADRQEALDKLKLLRGRAHTLISGVCLVQNDEVIWQCVDTATVTMRSIDDAGLERYADAVGAVLTECVGGYELEKAGAWLLEKVEGDYFTVLGMPLLALLGQLQTKGFTL